MTCFWDGIMKSLNQNDFNFINEKKINNFNIQNQKIYSFEENPLILHLGEL